MTNGQVTWANFATVIWDKVDGVATIYHDKPLAFVYVSRALVILIDGSKHYSSYRKIRNEFE